MEQLFSANAIPITPSNYLRLAFWNASDASSYTIVCRYQVQNKDGSVSDNVETVTVAASAAGQVNRLRLPYGNLLAVSLTHFSGILQNGNLYASIAIQYGDVADNSQLLPLIGGYVIESAPLNYPLTEPKAVNSGVPATVVITVPSPGLGNNQVYTSPANTQRRLSAGKITLTTDANVGNRTITLRVIDQTGQVYESTNGSFAAANETKNFFLWTTPLPTAAPTNAIYLPILQTPFLQTLAVEFNIIGVQVGDEITATSLWFDQYVNIA